MAVLATAARGVGIAILLVPVPLVIALLVGATRTDRVNTFLLWFAGLSLLPAIWLTALRIGWSGCAECLPKYDGGAMSFVLPAVPLLIVAAVMLFARREHLAAGLMIAAQALMAVGLAKVNSTGLVLIIVFVALEALYLGLRTVAQRSAADGGASWSAPGGEPR
jgi:hypothetical protein